MASRLKKHRKSRGKVSSGYGRIGKHRKHPGGKGKSGGQHHHKILFDSFEKPYFGKIGMRIFSFRKSLNFSYILNYYCLESLALIQNIFLSSKIILVVSMIDTYKVCIDKLLSKGRSYLTNCIVTLRKVSSSCSKILTARGNVYLVVID